jgi:neural Wiskott-Aldrich syndrome protein
VTATGGSPSNPALTQQPPRPQPFSPNDTAPDESEAEVQEPAEEEQVIEEGVEGGQAMPTPALRPGMQVFPGQQNPNSPTPAPGVGMPGAARPGIMMEPQPQRPTFRNPYGMPNQLPPGAPPPPPPGAPPPEQR